uniref:Eukaryotic translation initiation factor 3 subunit K n=1 Tax=Blastobotrys adeninivorans TaxID=409370 RepID=A0A060TD43_BLAAD
MENTLIEPVSTRPDEVNDILNSLDRYNPKNVKPLQDYVLQQAAENRPDIAANLALLKLYQFNAHLAKDEVCATILALALTRFYSSDFTTALHLLPPSATAPPSEEGTSDGLSDGVQKLIKLYELLDSAHYAEFWHAFRSDDASQDLVADVSGFADAVRSSIAKTVAIVARQVPVSVFLAWTNLSEAKLESWVSELGWTIKDNIILIPANKDNEAKPVVTSETVRFDQLSKIIKRAYDIRA